MPAGHKSYRLRGGVDKDDFPARDISLKDLKAVGRIAWEKWGHMVSDKSPRELIALAYAEGLYHGASIALRDPLLLASTNGSPPSGPSSPVANVSSCVTTATETPNVRDLLESL